MAQIKNLNKVLKSLEKFGKEAENEVEDAVIKAAGNIELDAKSNAPVNKNPKITGGSLRQSINRQPIDNLNWSIGTSLKYAPYQEFGTGAAVDLSYLTEAEYPSSYASQFRGQGKRQVNIPAQPFLFPALIKNRSVLIDDLKKSLKDLTNKYN